MIKNYFKIAIRQLLKQKMYSTIKIGGFALSIAACLLIALYIKDELSYDRSYPNADRIYRIVAEFNDNGIIQKGDVFPPPMAKAVVNDFPEVEQAGRLMPNKLFTGAGSNYLRRSDQQQNIYEDGFSYADPEILNILKIPLVYGNPAHALNEPRTMLISKKKADKYFPGQDPVGKTIFLNDDKSSPYKIGGVMQDFATNSHLQYDFLLTLAGVEWWPGEQAGWGSSNYPVYVLLKQGTNTAMLEKKLSEGLLKKYWIPSMIAGGQKNAEELAKKFALHLQSVHDIHLRSSGIHDELSHGDIRFVWLFGAVACFILIIACINFINLSTAKSASRAKEVGLRKVAGSHRGSLIRQFLVESFLFSLLSFFMGLLLAWAILPYFNQLSAKSLVIPWTAWWLLPMMLATAFLIGMVAGVYPSLYLSSFKPIDALKRQSGKGARNVFLRNGLVVFQFATSIILIISTFVIYRQTHFILNTKLGFDKDQVLLIQGANTLGEEGLKSFKNELLKLSQVKSASVSDYLPIAATKRNGNMFYNQGMTKEEGGVSTQFWIVDEDYIKTMGMKIVAGRNFSAQLRGDSAAVIINQTLAAKLNLKDPVGRHITNGTIYNVVGVVEDFNFESMRDNIGGVCMHLGTSPTILSVKVNTANMKGLIPSVTNAWKKFAPAQPIRYTFLDESFANMYADVQRMGRIFTGFAILAIIIACLGLFALSAFVAEQRNKEIGVRKVLGASVVSITTLLSKDFIKLVLLAIVIATPIAWWAMTKWLQDFVYRIAISWWMIAIAALIGIAIALITISFQSVKAAMMNPVQSLRSE